MVINVVKKLSSLIKTKYLDDPIIISSNEKDIKIIFKNLEKFLNPLIDQIIEKQKINLTVFEVLTVIFIINAAKINNDFNLIEAGALLSLIHI